jgi:hypothetical protein
LRRRLSQSKQLPTVQIFKSVLF